MANDNQTALGMSIQRKKDEVKRIENKIYLAKWDNSFHPTQEEYAKLSVLPGEITEDEKLLEVESHNIMGAYLHGVQEGSSGSDNFQSAKDYFNQKYGTDGK